MEKHLCSNLTPEVVVNGNDPYFYGEKMKAYLIAGARRFSVERVYPNPTLGFGVLCLRESFMLTQ